MEHFLVSWGYPALFVITFLSSMGIPIGSEAAMAYGGVLASGAVAGAGNNHFNLLLVIVVALIGEVAGSFAGYAIGYFGGRPLVDRFGRYILLSHRDLDRIEAWFKRYGGAVAFFGRLVPLARSFVSFAAGLAEMRIVPFFAATVAGSGIFIAALVSLGYSLGSSWNTVLHKFSFAGYVVAVLIVIAVIAAWVLRYRAVRREQSGTLRAAHSPAARRRAAEQEALERTGAADAD